MLPGSDLALVEAACKGVPADRRELPARAFLAAIAIHCGLSVNRIRDNASSARQVEIRDPHRMRSISREVQLIFNEKHSDSVPERVKLPRAVGDLAEHLDHARSLEFGLSRWAGAGATGLAVASLLVSTLVSFGAMMEEGMNLASFAAGGLVLVVAYGLAAWLPSVAALLPYPRAKPDPRRGDVGQILAGAIRPWAVLPHGSAEETAEHLTNMLPFAILVGTADACAAHIDACGGLTVRGRVTGHRMRQGSAVELLRLVTTGMA